jgi:cytochrome P450 family 135
MERMDTQLPDGPRSPPLVQIARWVAQPLQMLDDCKRRYGSVFTFAPPREAKIVIVSDPELVKAIFKAPTDVLLAGVVNATILEPVVGKNSLLTLDGDEHIRQRRLLLPSFHGERMQAYATVMREITESNLATWPTDQPFALQPMMQSITLDVILKTVFGLDTPEKAAALRSSLVELLEIAANPFLFFFGVVGLDPFKVPWLRITKLKRAVDVELYRMIAEARKSGARGTDVLSMMLGARDEAGQGMSDVELRDELVTLLLAGHETTATALAWTFDRLLANPETLERLRSDLAAGSEEYLDAVIRETLRVRPIIPLVGRHVAKPYQLGRWTLPVGSRVAPSIYLLGRRPEAYPEPDRFMPERHLGVKPDPMTWIPFGGGTRRCIGMAFALFEMRIVLQTIVPRMKLTLVGGEAKVVRRGITLAPAGGTRVVASRVRAAA